ncbi:uncharacterized protein LOC135104767 isoform X2 [Scylla paramamosain]|uniref:uncharacterized protein LOC135104767 isoform X2 n=1 Tax=Scylla paramamosain TaxID=85552 RepID=UPI003082E100
MNNLVVFTFCLLVGVAMSAPTNTLPENIAEVSTTEGDTDDIFDVIKKTLPLIRESIDLFRGGVDAEFRGVNTGTDLGFRDSPRSSNTPPGAVGNVNGFDSPFVPNYVIPGYTIPGNRFTPDIHIPEVHIS